MCFNRKVKEEAASILFSPIARLKRIGNYLRIKPPLLSDTFMKLSAGQFLNGRPRVRVHGDVARIECLPGYIEKIIHDPEREHIIKSLKKIGFRYISLDLEGYRTGSLNPEKLKK